MSRGSAAMDEAQDSDSPRSEGIGDTRHRGAPLFGGESYCIDEEINIVRGKVVGPHLTGCPDLTLTVKLAPGELLCPQS